MPSPYTREHLQPIKQTFREALDARVEAGDEPVIALMGIGIATNKVTESPMLKFNVRSEEDEQFLPEILETIAHTNQLPDVPYVIEVVGRQTIR